MVYPFGKAMRSFDGGALLWHDIHIATRSRVPPKRAHRIVVVSGIVVRVAVGVHIPNVGRFSA